MAEGRARFTGVCAAAALACLVGCGPTYSNHGFAPQIAELDAIEAGADTRGSVLRRLGRPSASGAFDEDVWFYVASRMEHFAFFEPEVIDRKVVVVAFDDAGLVERVNRYGLDDGRIVDLVSNTTPTYGRELSALQQLFGNIGAPRAADVLN
ncbi:outer membrane protein assembly factor BamE [Rubrimonas cliftonensis]|uniref:Beta-barrel assembly machine subunit BamE n=1 Tax=Rubrimonas cliftonensis TaxID=89524 RepID=A0A1H3XFS4_9RHOB|nr:outer membrane protein assembly factor BamE [Rubrimonas cliftonensis]SDZ97462.1 Beta-barrel assembly machine subunit BamE [Rubrimonas cliftonensis]